VNAVQMLQKLARPKGLDFLARYPATVLISRDGNIVDVEPDDKRLPKLEKISLRVTAPDFEVKVARGTRVLVAFEGGDPRFPFAEQFGAGSLEKLKIAGGGQKAARVADTVKVTIPPFTVLVAIPTAPFFAPNPTPIELTGTIESGSSKVEIG
jgi:hypothetical protein